MTYDLVIRNGRIVDGTGRPSFIGDVAVKGDRIALVGRVSDLNGAEVIDAEGRVVSPGFIEIHTHYDPQLCWDRRATPAGEHGVTTVIMGNCGLSLAPIRPGFGPRVTRMFNKIEDIDVSFFDAAVPYSWTSFPEYLDYIRDGLGVNVAPVVGHSILRHFVMGEAAQERAASGAEVEEMCALLREAIAAGAFGLSMSYEHLTDEYNRPMASAFADVAERIALARTVVECGRLYVQANLNATDFATKLKEYEELGQVALESGACCSALALLDAPYQAPKQYELELDKLAELNARGARIYGQTMVRPLDVSFRLTKALSLFYMAPIWADIMLKPVAERIRLLSDRSIWPDLSASVLNYLSGTDFVGRFRVKDVKTAQNRHYLGRSLAEIGEAEGTTSICAMLGIAVADDLETLFDCPGIMHGDVDVVAMLLDHPLIQVGGSDAGAHVAQFAGEGDATFLLRHFVRDHGKLTLERAIQRITSDAARDFGIARRGAILPGNYADLVVFDPATVDRSAEILVRDLPGGGERYIRSAIGIEKVFVNGRLFVDGGQYTLERAGTVV
jgi:N-acyl-D-aspartate/D-glutamate deacylase